MMQFKILSAELYGVAISQIFYCEPKRFGIRTGLKWSRGYQSIFPIGEVLESIYLWEWSGI